MMRLSIRSIVPGLVALAMFAAPAAAQMRPRTEFGVGLSWRRQLGTLPDSTDRRRGLGIRLQADIPWKPYVGWRVEGGYVQVKYDMVGPLDDIPITETDFELGGFVRLTLPKLSKPRPYIVAGAIGSLRGSCDISNAFGDAGSVRCAEGEDFLLGWGAGAGLQLREWVGGWHWFIETKYIANVVAAAGGKMITVSIGAGQ
jgi:hypothetical protein